MMMAASPRAQKLCYPLQLLFGGSASGPLFLFLSFRFPGKGVKDQITQVV
jgi:hypothetical protein